MLTEYELRRLMSDTESDRVERTTSTKATEDLSRLRRGLKTLD